MSRVPAAVWLGSSARVAIRPENVAAAEQVLDPDVLTLGFARRFTTYKRPNLLLHDTGRLRRLLIDRQRPVQLVLAGKVHRADDEGKRMIQAWIALTHEPELCTRLVFLEDYDLSSAGELVQGVDVWINMPSRPWEACGTSGMKVLVNGGFNLSVLDRWSEEAYDPNAGWVIGDGDALDEAARDGRDAATLYDILENKVVPAFFARDVAGSPRDWLARIRCSLSRLTPPYSSNRLPHEYIEPLYLAAADEFHRRSTDKAAVAVAMHNWECRLRRGWPRLRIGNSTVRRCNGAWQLSAAIDLGDIGADDVRVDIYAEPRGSGPPVIISMKRGVPVSGSVTGYIYAGAAPASRAVEDCTIRVVPTRPGIVGPAELEFILWQK